MSKYYIIGIDEVGRGPLAGPVTAAAVAIPEKLPLRGPTPVKDSKKLNPRQRQTWEKYLKNHRKILCAVSSVSVAKINTLNIARAANIAANSSFRKLLPKIQVNKIKIKDIFLDGSLFLLPRLSQKFKSQTVIKGDEQIAAVALASIVAKTHRDKIMMRLHRQFPAYGFDRHKGYGTSFHIQALKSYGPCPFHRLTFIKKFINI
jgi:ribonuclease HII